MSKLLQNKPKTKLFLDSGDPKETKEAIDMLGYLDGQTTNPSLVTKNPKIAGIYNMGAKLSEKDLLKEYRRIVEEISELIPDGSISIEVYAEKDTPAEEMVNQAKEMNSWIPNAHIKLPLTSEGLKAESELLKQGIKVNMTLVFSQEQAAAVHSAAGEINKGDVFVSPFAGRLNDNCRDGMDLITNISRMYKENNSNVEVLAASIRDVPHLMYSLYAEVDIITIPFKVLKEWHKQGLPIPGVDIDIDEFKDQNEFFSEHRDPCIIDIEYKKLDLNRNYSEYNIEHELTGQGLEKFVADWKKLIS